MGRNRCLGNSCGRLLEVESEVACGVIGIKRLICGPIRLILIQTCDGSSIIGIHLGATLLSQCIPRHFMIRDSTTFIGSSLMGQVISLHFVKVFGDFKYVSASSSSASHSIFPVKGRMNVQLSRSILKLVK